MPVPTMSHHVSRRAFLRNGALLMTAAATIPSFLGRAVAAAGAGPGDGRVLVVVQLSGGNDGLNTVVPYADDAYYRARPRLAIPAGEVIKLRDGLGLHPALQPLQKVWDEGRLSVVHGVGYPNPDRSHFRSMEIWHAASVEPDVPEHGWLGRFFDHTCDNAQASASLGVCVDETLSPAMLNGQGVGISLLDAERFYRLTAFAAGDSDSIPAEGDSQLDFLRRTVVQARVAAADIRDRVRGVRHLADYPRTAFADQLKLVAAMIAGGMGTRVYYVSLGGFDTHANQAGPHANLMETLAGGLAAFQDDLQRLQMADRVTTFTFSEFGRRVAENGSGGTDHGQAAPLFVMGAPVRGGEVGSQPSLTELRLGDVTYGIDFRRLYATLLEEWLSAPAEPILGQRWEPLPLLSS